MVNCSAQATQLQQSQSIGEVEAQGQIRIVQQARGDGCILRLPDPGRWPDRCSGAHGAGGNRSGRSVTRRHVAEASAPRSQEPRIA